MRPAAKIVNIFAAWFSNFAIRMIFDSPFNELVMNLHQLKSCPADWKVDEGGISQSIRFQPDDPALNGWVSWPFHRLKALDDLNFS